MKTIPIQKTTIDMATGASTTEAVQASLLPPPAGTCQECGRAHPAEAPHDAQSMYYQYAFYGQHDRWPTWADAMAHCPPFIRDQWTRLLTERGITVGNDVAISETQRPES